jgi:hypothetical protein
MQNSKAKLYYDLLLKTKKEALEKLPLQYRAQHEYYKLPGIRTQFIEKFYKSKKSFLANVASTAREAWFTDQDDTQFGELTALNNKMVPIYFNHTFNDAKDVSKDLSRSFAIYAEMAENFQQMNKIAGDMETVLYQLGKREYIKKGIKTPGVQSNEYQALENLMDSLIYSIQKKDYTYTIKDNAFLSKLPFKIEDKLVGKTISASKITLY